MNDSRDSGFGTRDVNGALFRMRSRSKRHRAGSRIAFPCIVVIIVLIAALSPRAVQMTLLTGVSAPRSAATASAIHVLCAFMNRSNRSASPNKASVSVLFSRSLSRITRRVVVLATFTRTTRRAISSETAVGAAAHQLAATGLVTFFGSLNAAVPFLLDLFRIPSVTFQFFLARGVVNSGQLQQHASSIGVDHHHTDRTMK